jgi:outer membrane protein assembly factor BamB
MSVNRSDSVFDNGNPIAWMWPKAPWPQYQYDSQSGGHTTATGGPSSRSALNEIPASDQILIDDNWGEYWAESYNPENYRLPGGTYTANNGNPCNTGAVVDGVLYFVDSKGNSYAINSSDASEKWVNTSTSTGNEAHGPILVDGGVAYWGDTAGNITAVNTNDGSQKFSTQIFPTGIEGKISIWKDTLVACDVEDRMAGVDATDGSLIWGTSDVGDFTTRGMTPAIMDGVAYVGAESNPESVIAVDASDGTILWKHSGSNIEKVISSVAVHPDAIIAADNASTMRALDPDDGSVLWTDKPVPVSDPWRPPVIAPDVVYGVLADVVYAYQIEDGSVVYTQRAQYYPNGPLTPFAGKLYYPYSPPM